MTMIVFLLTDTLFLSDMLVKKYLSTTAFFLVLFLGLCGQADASDKLLNVKTVALMPFGTFSVEGLSIDVTRVVSDSLEKHHLKVVPQEVLEGFLVERRIRRSDFLDRPAVRAMGTALKIDALVMGTVDVIRGGRDPHVSMNAQMIDCLDAAIVWANSVSRTGADYATFLGLGKITSLEELVGITVEELFDGLPKKVNLDSSLLSPFEVIRADFYPHVLRGGETARLSLEINEITGKVRDVKAFVLDSQVPLKTEDGRWYSGTATAPSIEGTYTLRIYVTDRWNRLSSVDAMASLTVQNSPPEITLFPRKRLLSPNRDGINDFVLFVPELLKAITLKRWTVEISNEDGQIVRSEEGMGALPEGFIWRGVDNELKTAPDGIYFCRLVAEDEAGNRTSTSRESVAVDSTAPVVTVSAVLENEDVLTLTLRSEDMSPIAYWELILYDTDGMETERFEGEGDIPDILTSVVKKKTGKG